MTGDNFLHTFWQVCCYIVGMCSPLTYFYYFSKHIWSHLNAPGPPASLSLFLPVILLPFLSVAHIVFVPFTSSYGKIVSQTIFGLCNLSETVILNEQSRCEADFGVMLPLASVTWPLTLGGGWVLASAASSAAELKHGGFGRIKAKTVKGKGHAHVAQPQY